MKLYNTNPDLSKVIAELQDTVCSIADKHGLAVTMFVVEAKGVEPIEGEDPAAIKVQNVGMTVHNMTAPLALVLGHTLSQNKGLFGGIMMGSLGNRIGPGDLMSLEDAEAARTVN